MLAKHAGKIPAAAVAEASEYLAWLGNDHFTFLGFRDYEISRNGGAASLDAVEGSGLGLLRQGDNPVTSHKLKDLSEGARELNKKPELVIITKTNKRSTVHRDGYMDYIGVIRYDSNGKVTGERRFLGLFTSNAYYRSAWDTPLVRTKVDTVLQLSGLRQNSHSWKSVIHILETLPRDELFQAAPEELLDLAVGILNLQERRRTKLFIRRERFSRFYSCMVFIPRDRFNTENREKIQAILKRGLKGKQLDYVVQVSESALARLHVIVRPRNGPAGPFDLPVIEQKIIAAVRSWHDDLKSILVDKHGEEEGLRLSQQFSGAFPASYCEDVSPWVAAFDVVQAASLENENDLRMSLYRPRKKSFGVFRLKIFKHNQPIQLSDVLPMLENLGFSIVNERPYGLTLADGQALWAQDFDMVPAQGGDLDLDKIRDPFRKAFEKVWRGVLENDGFNQLVLASQLHWRQVAMLRTYCKYLLQTGLPFSQIYMEQTLVSHPLITRLLVELFESMFHPASGKAARSHRESAARSLGRLVDAGVGNTADTVLREYLNEAVKVRSGARSKVIPALRVTIQRALEGVKSLDEDRILRAFTQSIIATLRTNYFMLDEAGKHPEYISIKLNSSRVPDLPKPLPFREIWVYSPRVEGVHLRGGKIARGGLRWSDRREDFRTEILGLMKAQNVKNTIIVPVGAKGGFVAKRLPEGDDRDAVMSEVIDCYKIFINGLLDITDNLVEDKIAPPKDLVRIDGDDPYLVVAADKGTASFSDLANSVALEHGFWLGDAFASGGSDGYDHKRMAITARGAWESVLLHFRELGINIQQKDFTVVGIGDMSGDVFGNGMLLSKHIRLQAAFNHRHILIDPSPDAKVSFAERQRLFAMPRSSWADYDESLLSEGGGIYSRLAKTIELSPQLQSWLGLEVSHLTPTELIRELLKAPVDLLWNGGIGTYVKSSKESHADVGDLANNPLRIDGNELRCKVAGEGGNLGFTQLGRIEFALAGGKINTDFIDNAAGVNCSDHEVNIKILLAQAIKSGTLKESGRKKLLTQMTDDVSALVLRSNYLQARAISMMEAFSVSRLGTKAHFISVLEQDGELDRDLEFLPDEEELVERRSQGRGLTRPELAVLLSYSKITLYKQLWASDVPEDPYLSRELTDYFPVELRKKFSDEMSRHRLKREIIANMVTNSMVNRMGASFALRMHEDTGASSSEVAKAYAIVREVFRAREYWSGIEKLDYKVESSVQTEALLVMWYRLRQATRWFLKRQEQPLDVQVSVDSYAAAMNKLREALPVLADREEQEVLKEAPRRFCEVGVPDKLGKEIVELGLLGSALDIIEEAAERGMAVDDVAKVYFELGDKLNLKWLSQQVESLSVDGQWHAHARGNLRDELYGQRRALAGSVLAAGEGSPDPVRTWQRKHRVDVSHLLGMLDDMSSLRTMDYATVSVALRALEQLVTATART
jgi:glutamate dehydrogenase